MKRKNSFCPKCHIEIGIILFLLLLGSGMAAEPIRVAGHNTQLSIMQVSDYTIRITLKPVDDKGHTEPLAEDLILVPKEWPQPILQVTELNGRCSLLLRRLRINVIPFPLTIDIATKEGKPVQRLVMDEKTGAISFSLGQGPVFGLGGGGRQFDRRGVFDPMDNGHRAGEYQIFGSRIPIPLLIGTDGWALFFHRPYNGKFDLRDSRGHFLPKISPKDTKERALPADFFVIYVVSPPLALSEYMNLTGKPVMPPKWTLGYIQSHRTLSGPDEIIEVAETFRRKDLPCDVLIYLGTGYCPAGWNMGHGSLEFNPKTFNKPKEIIDRLHKLHFKVILHKNRAPKTLHGEFPADVDEEAGPHHIVNYWEKHRPIFELGIDGWWPDDGDELPIDSRLARHLIYYKGPLADRPGKRPFSLHRTGFAGMQKYGGWVWSGDVFSLWNTLSAHIPVGLNFSLSASPFWGTDIGGFSPTKELTGELYVRWFQFGSFCPIFRSHGRLWYLRRPWGWNTGELGPNEVVEGHKGTAAPDPSELHNPEVEPICKQYINLRYQLLPYTYTVVREAYDTGMPIMRAMWLHYPDDLIAVRLSDQYLWGRNILVAPVTEKGATHRCIYIPEGLWYDFWTNRTIEGRQRIARYADLSTMPIYVQAGTILPFGPLIQYVDQPSDDPMTIRIYTGSDGEFVLYEDDGISLEYKKDQAEWTRFEWNDNARLLIIEPDERSTLQANLPKPFEVLLLPERASRAVEYAGRRIEVKF